ncbi:MAG TPA: hypothetical protein VEW28_07160 [Candidatus Kapabacteria bacterium]|nr:hypothetical protein [Candidatus Kapabacteria bacterium]
MIFVETRLFTKYITDFLSDEDYRKLQTELLVDPEKGAVIPGGKGIRKLRWAASSKGKRGGLRIIYYFQVRRDEILMLYAYRKSDVKDLTKIQLRQLVTLIEEKYK